MYTRNKRLRLSAVAGVLLWIAQLVGPLQGQSDVLEFTASKGVTIKIIRDSSMRFLHATLLVFFRNPHSEPAIPYLTMENLFSESLDETDTKLQDLLKRLGNDYTVEYHPDRLSVRVNFLAGQIPLFTQFLRELFSYKSFSLKRFNTSAYNYHKLLVKKQDWEKILAERLAYSVLFQGNPLGNTVIKRDALLRLNLAQIRSYYRQNYRPENSVLLLKGNINPHIAFGLIEKGLKSLKNQDPVPRRPLDPVAIPTFQRQILILDAASNEAPIMFWFQAIPPVDHEQYLYSLIVNEILFGYPIGNLFRNASGFGIRNIRRMDTEITYHGRAATLCNTIYLAYEDLEKFILLTDHEIRKMQIRRIDRKEYLETLNFFLGKSKVDTERFDEDVREEAIQTIAATSAKDFRLSSSIFRQVTLEHINRFVTRKNHLSRDGSAIGSVVIVIVGDAQRILQNLRTIKPSEIHTPF